MTLTGKELIRLLQKEGWETVRIKGSHHVLSKDSLTLVVPVHGNKPLPAGLLNAILKQAGLK